MKLTENQIKRNRAIALSAGLGFMFGISVAVIRGVKGGDAALQIFAPMVLFGGITAITYQPPQLSKEEQEKKPSSVRIKSPSDKVSDSD